MLKKKQERRNGAATKTTWNLRPVIPKVIRKSKGGANPSTEEMGQKGGKKKEGGELWCVKEERGEGDLTLSRQTGRARVGVRCKGIDLRICKDRRRRAEKEGKRGKKDGKSPPWARDKERG